MEIKQKDRNSIENKYKWNLKSLYDTDEAWLKDYNELLSKVNDFNKYKKQLGKVDNLISCLDLYNSISKNISRVYVYANMKSHEDMNVAKYQGYSDMADTLVTKFNVSTSFIEPEIIELETSFIEDVVKNNEELKEYEHYLNNLLREKEHILSIQMEELLASTGEITSGPDTIYSMINNADMKFENIKNEHGKDVELTAANFSMFLESKSRDVRKSAFHNIYKSYINQKNTLVATYTASIKIDVFYSKARKYKSSLDYALSTDNIPNEVYTNLIKVTEDNLHLMHKYVDKRKEILKLDKIHVYDLYTPLVEVEDKRVDFETAKDIVIKSLKPLGKEYVSIIEKAFKEGWIDIYENKGKKTGAYSWGTYGAHPYILLNYNNMVDDMFTLTHELGHSLHSYYTWETQPYVYSSYTIFVAEVASIVNESLLMKYLLKNIKNKNEKKYLINHFLDQFKGTFFRQTKFAEFEKITHEIIEKGEPITLDVLNSLYKDLLVKYYGKNIVLDEEISMEWARIPHFYSAFYVYQYATGFAAAIALSNKILNEGEDGVKLYIEFLKSGSSDYSINLLKKCGVDMLSTKPLEDALKVFEELLESL